MKATEQTVPSRFPMVPAAVPSEVQNRIERSSPPVARSFPSGLQATQFTICPCARSVCRQRPSATDQIRAVLSDDAVASRLAPGANATPLTLSMCPVRTRWHCPVATSQIRAVLSRDPDARSGRLPGVAANASE